MRVLERLFEVDEGVLALDVGEKVQSPRPHERFGGGEPFDAAHRNGVRVGLSDDVEGVVGVVAHDLGVVGEEFGERLDPARILGFGGLSVKPVILEAQTGISDSFGITVRSTLMTLAILILINGTLGLFVAFGAVGEELGWRGFLIPELYKHYSFTKTSFISGAIWSVYHYPLLIVLMAPRLEVSAWPLLVAALIGGIGLTFILNWYRLKSGSVWTAVIFHAALNIHNQGFFQNLTVKSSWLTNYVSGEHGFMLAIVSAVAAYFFWRMRDGLPTPAN